MNDVHEVRAREIEMRRDVFQAIADPTRRAILSLLLRTTSNHTDSFLKRNERKERKESQRVSLAPALLFAFNKSFE
jgi:DNA-binding transcriptional ArsR family regulator